MIDTRQRLPLDTRSHPWQSHPDQKWGRRNKMTSKDEELKWLLWNDLPYPQGNLVTLLFQQKASVWISTKLTCLCKKSLVPLSFLGKDFHMQEANPSHSSDIAALQCQSASTASFYSILLGKQPWALILLSQARDCSLKWTSFQHILELCGGLLPPFLPSCFYKLLSC